MKKLILAALLIIGVGGADQAVPAMGNRVQYFVVTATGTTVLNWDFNSTEIYIVTGSTYPAYVNYKSTFQATTSDLALGTIGETIIYEHTEEIHTSTMTVQQTTAPMHMRIQIKGW